MRRLALLGLLLPCACAAHLQLTRDQLWAVAGLPAGALRTVYTDQGPFTFGGDLPVSVVTKSGALAPSPLSAMRHAGEGLVLHPAGGDTVEVQRQDVVRAEASFFSTGRTLGLVSLLTFGAAFLYIFVGGLAFL